MPICFRFHSEEVNVKRILLLQQVMFRAGKLAVLEEIRENALSVIITKMQCHIRRILILITYKKKRDEK